MLLSPGGESRDSLQMGRGGVGGGRNVLKLHCYHDYSINLPKIEKNIFISWQV